MKIKDTIDFIEGLMNDNQKKTERKFYKTFLDLLLSLQQKELHKEKIKLIENKLDELDITLIHEKRAKYLKWKHTLFTQFLEKEFSLILQWHYVWLGMVYWMLIGLAVAGITWLEFGMASESTGGLVGGMFIGILVGSMMDSIAVKENRVLIIK